MRYLLILLLAGCATPEQKADTLIAKHGPFCDKLGYQRDTDAWRGCVTQQQSVSAQQRAASAINAGNVQKSSQLPK